MMRERLCWRKPDVIALASGCYSATVILVTSAGRYEWLGPMAYFSIIR